MYQYFITIQLNPNQKKIEKECSCSTMTLPIRREIYEKNIFNGDNFALNVCFRV